MKRTQLREQRCKDGCRPLQAKRRERIDEHTARQSIGLLGDGDIRLCALAQRGRGLNRRGPCLPTQQQQQGRDAAELLLETGDSSAGADVAGCGVHGAVVAGLQARAGRERRAAWHKRHAHDGAASLTTLPQLRAERHDAV